ncbi:pilus assembly protein PilS [Neisseria meningitidis]|nr:pilus assembly protein PilS [Neisseria meningitidis]
MPSFPRTRESRPLGMEIYRVKRFLRFYVLDSRLRGNDGRGSAEEVAHSGG